MNVCFPMSRTIISGVRGKDDGIRNLGVGDGGTREREGVFDPERNWQRLVRGVS